MGATTIEVEDLGAAMEAMSFGAAVAGSMSRGFRNDIRPPFHEECTRMSGTASFAARCGRSAAHLARLALGEVRP